MQEENIRLPSFAALQAHICQINGRYLALSLQPPLVVVIPPLLAELMSGLQDKADSWPELSRRLTLKWGENAFSQACAALEKMTSDGLFLPQKAASPKASAYPKQWRADLTVTHRCNLACRYCFAPLRDGSEPPFTDLPPDRARQALIFLLENFGEPDEPLILRFGNTGETLLALEAQAQLRALATELAEERGRKIIFHWGNTNLTPAADPEILTALLASPYLPHLGISLDGPKEVQDSIRIFPDGRGTHSVVEPIARQLLQSEHPPHVHCTFSGLNPDITRIFTYLYELGFRDIRLRPVRATPDSPQGYTPETVAGLQQGFADWVRFLDQSRDEELLQYLTAANPNADFLLRFVFKLSAGMSQQYRCPAGKDYVCLDTNGDIYPCAYFIASGQMKLGSIYDGFDEPAVARFWQDLHIDRKASCAECWAKYLCGGGCYYQAFLSHGDVTQPDENKCRLVRHLCEQAAYLVSSIYLRPAVRDRLLPHWAKRLAPTSTNPEVDPALMTES